MEHATEWKKPPGWRRFQRCPDVGAYHVDIIVLSLIAWPAGHTVLALARFAARRDAGGERHAPGM